MSHEIGHLMNRQVEQGAAVQQGIVDGLAALGMMLDRKNPETGLGTVRAHVAFGPCQWQRGSA